MKELQRTDRLILSISLFLLLIIIGFLTIRNPDLKYTRDISSSALDAQNPETFISPLDLNNLSVQEGSFILIDIRNIYDYTKGHIPSALHIPKIELLDEHNLTLYKSALRENKTIVLYGNDQLDATGPGLLLRDVGFDNVKVLLGGYHYMISQAENEQTQKTSLMPEEPRYNFAEMVSSPKEPSSSTPGASAPEVIVPVRKDKAKAEGGC